MIWLIDSRGRLVDGKRHLWTWDDNDPGSYRAAWSIVLRAEISEPQERLDYECYYDQDMPAIEYVPTTGGEMDFAPEARGLCEMFNDFWSMYGWELFLMNNEDEPLADDIVVMNNKPARECYAVSYA